MTNARLVKNIKYELMKVLKNKATPVLPLNVTQAALGGPTPILAPPLTMYGPYRDRSLHLIH